MKTNKFTKLLATTFMNIGEKQVNKYSALLNYYEIEIPKELLKNYLNEK